MFLNLVSFTQFGLVTYRNLQEISIAIIIMSYSKFSFTNQFFMQRSIPQIVRALDANVTHSRTDRRSFVQEKLMMMISPSVGRFPAQLRGASGLLERAGESLLSSETISDWLSEDLLSAWTSRTPSLPLLN